MKVISRKSRYFVALTAAAIGCLSSCNRGVGCPTNFSVNEIIENTVSSLIGLMF